jgi:hypothetical protein
LRDKWSNANAFKIAFTKDNPLGQWRYIVQELYGIKSVTTPIGRGMRKAP